MCPFDGSTGSCFRPLKLHNVSLGTVRRPVSFLLGRSLQFRISWMPRCGIVKGSPTSNPPEYLLRRSASFSNDQLACTPQRRDQGSGQHRSARVPGWRDVANATAPGPKPPSQHRRETTPIFAPSRNDGSGVNVRRQRILAPRCRCDAPYADPSHHLGNRNVTANRIPRPSGPLPGAVAQ